MPKTGRNPKKGNAFMASKKDSQRTSWGDKPGKPLVSSRVTRRDLPRIAAKATIGVLALTGGVRDPDQPDVDLHTAKPRRP